MSRTFRFDDGQAWHVQLTGLTYRAQEIVSVHVSFWSDVSPDQRVARRVQSRGLALTDTELSHALRHALQLLAHGVEVDA
ncbi:MAG: hypothetical protein ABI051_13495 [Vicinamibacterales bacterium]